MTYCMDILNLKNSRYMTSVIAILHSNKIFHKSVSSAIKKQFLEYIKYFSSKNFWFKIL